jgi:hypothetical protein
MDEQRQFEQHWIEQLKPSLNMNRSFNTHEDTQQQMKQYYDKNKEAISKQAKGRYEKNKEKYKQQMKEHYKQNKEKYKEHRKKNKEKRNQKMKEYGDSIRRSCVCGGRYRDVRSFRDRHFNSTKHTSFVLDFYERLNNILAENND